MTETEKYVKRYLSKELKQVQGSAFAQVNNGLDIYERTLIYYYTGSGYQAINSNLRRTGGRRGLKVGALLDKALMKLPSHRGFVHRTARLTKKQIQKYKDSLQRNKPIIEPSFISTSKSTLTARLYPNWNVRFRVISKHGKNIEHISQMGTLSLLNEQEVLIGPRHSFRVLDVTDVGSTVLIILEEL